MNPKARIYFYLSTVESSDRKAFRTDIFEKDAKTFYTVVDDTIIYEMVIISAAFCDYTFHKIINYLIISHALCFSYQAGPDEE